MPNMSRKRNRNSRSFLLDENTKCGELDFALRILYFLNLNPSLYQLQSLRGHKRFDFRIWHNKRNNAHGIAGDFILLVNKTETVWRQVWLTRRKRNNTVFNKEHFIKRFIGNLGVALFFEIGKHSLTQKWLNFVKFKTVNSLFSNLSERFNKVNGFFGGASMSPSGIGISGCLVCDIAGSVVNLANSNVKSPPIQRIARL